MVDPLELNFKEYGYTRYYDIDGLHLPSVTTVLSAIGDKNWYKEWVDRVGEEEAAKVSKQATEHGTKMHEAFEAVLKNTELPQLNPLQKIILGRGMPILRRISGVLCQETVLYSKKWRYAGRVDCVGRFDGKLSIIDFKTSRLVKQRSDIDGYITQTSMYAAALEQMLDVKVDQLTVLIFNQTASPTVFEETYDDSKRQLARDAAKAYWNKQLGVWK